MTVDINRRNTRRIHVGNVPVGDGAPIAVQSMTNTYTQDVAATVAQIRRLEAAGCEIVRVAVPDMEAAAAIAAIKKQITIPLIADIHFDHQAGHCRGRRRRRRPADQSRQYRRRQKNQGRGRLLPGITAFPSASGSMPVPWKKIS